MKIVEWFRRKFIGRDGRITDEALASIKKAKLRLDIANTELRHQVEDIRDRRVRTAGKFAGMIDETLSAIGKDKP